MNHRHSRVATPQTRAVVRVVLVALVAVLLVPAAQVESWATPVTLSETIEGLPVDTDRAPVGLASVPEGAGEVPDAEPLSSVIEAAPIAFSAVGASAPAEVTAISVRTSVDGDAWTDWQALPFLDVEDGPDPGSVEARQEAPGRHTEILWVGEATHLQVTVEGGSPEDVDLTVIDSMRLNGGPVQRHSSASVGTAADASGLDIVSRARWGADESLGSSTRSVSNVHMGIVHHTAHTSGSAANTYTRDQAPGLLRAMHRYHTVTLGWSDLGYNVVVDRFGTVYEGRKGGFNNGVVGAHAAGFNTGSFGVAVIGNFVNEQASSAAIDALTRVIAVKSAIHGIDPEATTTRMGDGRARPTILGHRDVGQTSCPGRIHDLLPRIRSEARAQAVRFPDVPASSPHRTAILELADAGVTSGCTLNEYCPKASLTRAQASTFVLQALELDPIPGSRFRDVPAGAVHAESINALVQRGWLIGYPDGTFRPWQELTRGQLATLLARSLELPLTTPATNPYPDVSREATHAPGIAALAGVGIRGNCGSGRFCADDVALRDSTASFVNMVRKVGGDLTATISLDHRTEVDGVQAVTPSFATPLYRVSIVDPLERLIATRADIPPGQEVTFTGDDGLEHGSSYRFLIRDQPGTVPWAVDGCSFDEVVYAFQPSASFQASTDRPVTTTAVATATYSCSSW